MFIPVKEETCKLGRLLLMKAKDSRNKIDYLSYTVGLAECLSAKSDTLLLHTFYYYCKKEQYCCDWNYSQPCLSLVCQTCHLWLIYLTLWLYWCCYVITSLSKHCSFCQLHQWLGPNIWTSTTHQACHMHSLHIT